MDQSVGLCRHLTAFAARRSRRVGFKFSNTLEVLNHRDFFTPENQIMYLSGQPLHVITMTLTDEFRRRVGPHVPISFSAGIDQHNFPLAAACGFAPITASTDLLRPGGYARLCKYLHRLTDDLHKHRAANLDEFILRRFDHADEARRLATDQLGPDATLADLNAAAVTWAGYLNTSTAVQLAHDDPRYRSDRNGKAPRRIDSHLETFDCITCDKCLPVCPNAANFTYPTNLTSFDVHDIIIAPDGTTRSAPPRPFTIDQQMQIACYADFCNECGNCDTFCPEYGGPYIKKPCFYGSMDSFRHAAPRDGCFIESAGPRPTIHARIMRRAYTLTADSDRGILEFRDGTAELILASADHSMRSLRQLDAPDHEHVVDMWVFHVLRTLLVGVLQNTRINQVNAALFTEGF